MTCCSICCTGCAFGVFCACCICWVGKTVCGREYESAAASCSACCCCSACASACMPSPCCSKQSGADGRCASCGGSWPVSCDCACAPHARSCCAHG
eukprot:2669070-Pleurochrysis_carterae.AAC.1